jgi:uncharacterized protein YukE
VTGPEELYARLSGASPSRIEEAADSIARAADRLGAAGTAVDQGASTAAADWTGPAADAFASHASRTGEAIDKATSTLIEAVHTLTDLADLCRLAQTSAYQVIQRWRQLAPGMDPFRLLAFAKLTCETLTNITSGYENALTNAATVLSGLKPVFEQAAQLTGEGRTSPAAAAIPPPGTDPREVRAWWDGLSPQEQNLLLANHYEELGQLRGLPAPVLDTANRRRIDNDRQRFGAQFDALDARITARARELGIDPRDEDALRQRDPALSGLIDARFDAARRKRNADAAYQRLTTAPVKDQPEAFVLHYNPDGPGARQGTLAVAFGNPDHADNIAVVVPGTGTRIDNRFPSGSAIDLRARMNETSPGSRNATIAWLGYDAPDKILGWDVTQDDQAVEGAKYLAEDVSGLRAGNPDAHVPVIGHSYGSTVVGHAGLHGLAADDIVFVGSPGVGASHADQLSAGSGHVWAGATEHDPVVQATGGSHFTADGSSTGPYDRSFGANRFGTGSDGNIRGAHSDYYEGTSLDNLGNIATGHYSDVSKQSWLDNPLGPELPGSDLPIIGGAIDAAGNTVKETLDVGTDVGGGIWDAGGEILHGDFSDAGGILLDTGGEVLNDAGDLVVGTLGDAAETGRDLYENTLGRLF